MSKNYLARLKNKAKRYDNIHKKLNAPRKKYNGTDLGRKFLAKAVAIAPKASQQITQSTIPLIYASLVADMSLPVNLSNLHNIAPSSKTIKDMVVGKASEYVCEGLESLVVNPLVYISCDKANSAKKGAKFSTLPKILTYYDPATRKIQEYMLDIDSSGENSREVAYAIQHALKKLQLIDDGFSLVLCGQTTDSGGGGLFTRSLEN